MVFFSAQFWLGRVYLHQTLSELKTIRKNEILDHVYACSVSSAIQPASRLPATDVEQGLEWLVAPFSNGNQIWETKFVMFYFTEYTILIKIGSLFLTPNQDFVDELAEEANADDAEHSYECIFYPENCAMSF